MRVCLVLVLAAAGGCALVRSPGAAASGARRFYLTKKAVPGNQAREACARGFHMASRFELADPSLLAYDTVLGFTTDDSGAGPPSAAATYETPGSAGWVRTGGGSQFKEAAEVPGSASANCSAWSTASHGAFGTAAVLTDRFGGPLWDGGSHRCDEAIRVWCVEDRISPAQREPSGRWRARHGPGGGDE